MSTLPPPEENIANHTFNPRGGPRTEEGKATSSKNAISHGLFTAYDFICPGEQTIYSDLAETLRAELSPAGTLEHNVVDEIRRAMWRLRRCGEVESNLVIGLDDGKGYIFDPMESTNAYADKVQRSVDRARSLSHRLLHKCTAELRTLQTERKLRNECFDAGTDMSHLGIADVLSLRKGLDDQVAAQNRHHPPPPAANASSFCKSVPTPPQTPRNAECPCGSGLKHKRCCGKDAPAVLGVTRNAA
jgi:hypothetical protein